MVKIYKEFVFDSAHFLPNVAEGHPCRHMHGHTYRMKIWLSGEPDPQTGWLMDFGDLKKQVQPLLTLMDHRVLNEISGLENPTAENISIWVWQKLKPLLPSLAQVEIHETPTSGVIYEGN
ncbi:MAG: 6-carboxytetrahydropterin synthase QueD [Bacteroidota bacterium]|jgi:6-pyruvoyltetrahydropterin/6-carboxytetrahydropterin synthase